MFGWSRLDLIDFFMIYKRLKLTGYFCGGKVRSVKWNQEKQGFMLKQMNSSAAGEKIHKIILPSRWHRNGFFYPMGYWGRLVTKKEYSTDFSSLKFTAAEKNFHISVCWCGGPPMAFKPTTFGIALSRQTFRFEIRTKSRGPKGLQLEVGARRAPTLLVIKIIANIQILFIVC